MKKIYKWEPWFFLFFGIFHLHRIWAMVDRKSYASFWLDRLKNLDGLCIIVTAPSDDPGYDCVSRVFVPELGIPEDPVTGSSHCMIAPYWFDRLNKDKVERIWDSIILYSILKQV